MNELLKPDVEAPTETFWHLAAQHQFPQLLKWLCSHNIAGIDSKSSEVPEWLDSEDDEVSFTPLVYYLVSHYSLIHRRHICLQVY